jgi:hypothetical protein
MAVDRDAAAVVDDPEGLAVGLEGHLDPEQWPFIASSTLLSTISQRR